MKVIKQDTKSMNEVANQKVICIREYKPKLVIRRCNLCEHEFEPTSKFERFCDECKRDSELYHFAEWLSA